MFKATSQHDSEMASTGEAAFVSLCRKIYVNEATAMQVNGAKITYPLTVFVGSITIDRVATIKQIERAKEALRRAGYELPSSDPTGNRVDSKASTVNSESATVVQAEAGENQLAVGEYPVNVSKSIDDNNRFRLDTEASNMRPGEPADAEWETKDLDKLNPDNASKPPPTICQYCKQEIIGGGMIRHLNESCPQRGGQKKRGAK